MMFSCSYPCCTGSTCLSERDTPVAWILACSTFDGPFKFVPDTVHSFSCESQFVAIELALLEELVEKCASIALQIAVTRDESSHSALVLDRNLHEFAVLQEAVHSGVVIGQLGRGLGCRRGLRS